MNHSPSSRIAPTDVVLLPLQAFLPLPLLVDLGVGTAGRGGGQLEYGGAD
jgi:hypothetical protein